MLTNKCWMCVACIMGVVGTSHALAQEASPAERQSDKAAGGVESGEVSEGRRIFDRAAEVVRGANAITYRAGINTTAEMLKNAYPLSRVDVKLLRAPAGSMNPWLTRVTGQMEHKEKGPIDIDLAWLASSVELVDHEKKEVVERAGKTAQGTGMAVAQQVRPPEIFGGEPYNSERGNVPRDNITYTMEGTRTLDGTLCDVVLVVKNERTKRRWAIARSDGFPRLIEQVFEGAMMSGSVTIDISNVSIDTAETPALKASELRVTVPEGYKETRVGAAPLPQPQPVPFAQPEDRLTRETTPAPERIDDESGMEMSTARPPSRVTTSDAQGPVLPRPAPMFELRTPSGNVVKLADMKGRVVVVQFFGSWCLQCPQWHQQLSEVVKPLTSRGVEVLALSVREREDSNAVAELSKGDFGFRHLLKAEGTAKDFGVLTYPATFVIDRDGIIQKEWQGRIGTDVAAEVAEAVNAALGGA